MATPSRKKQAMPRPAAAAKYPNARQTMCTWKNATPVVMMIAAETGAVRNAAPARPAR